MNERIPDVSNDIVEIEGKKYRRRYIGDMKGLDDEPLTEKSYYSHAGPGWDFKFGYLEDRGLDSVEQLSDEPYIYRLIEE